MYGCTLVNFGTKACRHTRPAHRARVAHARTGPLCAAAGSPTAQVQDAVLARALKGAASLRKCDLRTERGASGLADRLRRQRHSGGSRRRRRGRTAPHACGPSIACLCAPLQQERAAADAQNGQQDGRCVCQRGEEGVRMRPGEGERTAMSGRGWGWRTRQRPPQPARGACSRSGNERSTDTAIMTCWRFPRVRTCQA